MPHISHVGATVLHGIGGHSSRRVSLFYISLPHEPSSLFSRQLTRLSQYPTSRLGQRNTISILAYFGNEYLGISAAFDGEAANPCRLVWRLFGERVRSLLGEP